MGRIGRYHNNDDQTIAVSKVIVLAKSNHNVLGIPG